MTLKTFADRGGFKLLAVARMSSGAYSVVCYLLNAMAAGIEEVLSSAGELSVLLGVSEKAVRQSLEDLAASKIIDITPGGGGKTLVIRLTLDPTKWDNLRRSQEKGRKTQLGDARNIRALRPNAPHEGQGNGQTAAIGAPPGLSSQDALLFPAMRAPAGQSPTLTALTGGKTSSGEKHAYEDPVEHEAGRVFEAFKGTHKGQYDVEKEKSYARLLVEAHPTDHVLTLIKHFAAEIPSLGMLAGAWLHYSENYHQAHQEGVDLDAYRKKHEAAERRLRSLANAEIKRAQANKRILTPDEEVLLRLFMRHRQPRKQLYWALQARERYPHLQDFFDVTSEIALAPPDHGTHKRTH